MNPASFWATLKRFDAYAKPMDDFRIRTRSKTSRKSKFGFQINFSINADK